MRSRDADGSPRRYHGTPGWGADVEHDLDVVTPRAAAALHGLLDAEGPSPGAGDVLPPLWHWLAFLPITAQRELGSDGHPRVGGFLPSTGLPRRMFAGGTVDFVGSALVSASLARRSRVTSVTEKEGRSGRLVFVAVTHELSSGNVPVITEVQNLVYRGGGRYKAPPPVVDQRLGDPQWDWTHELRTDPTVLFRFSALTYNAHRIHYDRGYATDTEGYPGLVVQGPLQAVALAELCRRYEPDRTLERFTFRALTAAFGGAPLQLRGRHVNNDLIELVALTEGGHVTMSATATLHPSGE